VTVPSDILQKASGVHMSLRPNEVLSAYDLICGVVIAGANDAAHTLAVEIDGSMEAFLLRMNQKAKALGMQNTLYYNVSGLDMAPSTTANDLLILGKYAYENETYMQMASTGKYVIAETETNGKHTLHTRNYLLSKQTYADYYYAPANGMNAGSTELAGYCIVASARIHDQNYLCIVMGADKFESFTLARDLFEWVSTCYQYKTVLSQKDVLAEIPVALADASDHVAVVADRDVTCFMPSVLEEGELEIRTEMYFQNLTAPVKAGMIVGQAEVYRQGKCIGSAYLVTSSALAKDHSAHLKRSALDFLTSTGFLLTVAIAIIIAIVYVLVIARIRYQRMVKQIMEIPEEESIAIDSKRPAKLPPKDKKEHH
ncbi:MAG: D-alanyl-D-alanine carboxypeptidase, partial [Clostridia bacterium]|nr:D-alanyl-D-alanine carboxypeptidase [Clostridia bacterium]